MFSYPTIYSVPYVLSVRSPKSACLLSLKENRTLSTFFAHSERNKTNHVYGFEDTPPLLRKQVLWKGFGIA